jgi:hypothetical protein
VDIIRAYRLTSLFLSSGRVAQFSHDSTSCIALWYALRSYSAVVVLTQPTGGDLVWAHEEVKQLFDGLAEVTVSTLLSPSTSTLYIVSLPRRTWTLPTVKTF